MTENINMLDVIGGRLSLLQKIAFYLIMSQIKLLICLTKQHDSNYSNKVQIDNRQKH